MKVIEQLAICKCLEESEGVELSQPEILALLMNLHPEFEKMYQARLAAVTPTMQHIASSKIMDEFRPKYKLCARTVHLRATEWLFNKLRKKPNEESFI